MPWMLYGRNGMEVNRLLSLMVNVLSLFSGEGSGGNLISHCWG